MKRRHQICIGIFLALAVVMGLGLLYAIAEPWQHQLGSLARLVRETLLAFLQNIPLPLYFLAFALLPVVGAPMTLFYLTAIPVMGTQSTMLGLFLAWIAVMINLTISYALGHKLLKPVLTGWLQKRGYAIPQIHENNQIRILLLLRTSPLPFPLQSLLLSVGGARFFPYLIVSWLSQIILGTAVMLMGDSILKGHFGWALIGLFSFFLLSSLAPLIRRKLQTRNATAL